MLFSPFRVIRIFRNVHMREEIEVGKYLEKIERLGLHGTGEIAIKSSKNEINESNEQSPALLDLDFPQGYRGLPGEPVAMGLKVLDSLGQTAPVLRKLNVLGFVQSWLLDRFQNRQTGAFDDPEIAALYRAIREEQVRLLALQDRANSGREA